MFRLDWKTIAVAAILVVGYLGYKVNDTLGWLSLGDGKSVLAVELSKEGRDGPTLYMTLYTLSRSGPLYIRAYFPNHPDPVEGKLGSFNKEYLFIEKGTTHVVVPMSSVLYVEVIEASHSLPRPDRHL